MAKAFAKSGYYPHQRLDRLTYITNVWLKLQCSIINNIRNELRVGRSPSKITDVRENFSIDKHFILPFSSGVAGVCRFTSSRATDKTRDEGGAKDRFRSDDPLLFDVTGSSFLVSCFDTRMVSS